MDSRCEPEAGRGASLGCLACGVPHGYGGGVSGAGGFVCRSPTAQRVLAYLEQHPGADGQELVQRCYCTKRHAYKVIKRLHAAGLIHISGWITDKGDGPFVRRFSAGSGVDVPKPKAMTLAEATRRHRERMEPIERELENVRKKTRRHKVTVDPLMAAFFGGGNGY